MARFYAINGSCSNESASTPTMLGLTSAATIRPKVLDLIIGSRAAPADQACTYTIGRYTAAGTFTSVTPQALDPADPSAVSTAGQNHTVEPTYTAGAVLLVISMNQRGSFRWVATPGGEIVLPATAANGIGLYSVSPTTAFVAETCIHFEE